MYTTFDFTKEFLDIDFEKILIDNNNTLINSHDRFIKHKQIYLELTNADYLLYKTLNDELIELLSQKNVQSSKRFFFTFLDNDHVNKLKFDIKTLIARCRGRLFNFLKYLETLNQEYTEYHQRPSSIRSITSSRSTRSKMSIETTFESLTNKFSKMIRPSRRKALE